MKMTCFIVVAMFAVVLTRGPVMAAQEGGKAPKKEADNLRPVAKTKTELDDFDAISKAKDPATILSLSQAYIDKYSASQMLGEVYALRMSAYFNTRPEPKMSEALDELKRALDFNARLVSEKTKEATDKNSPALRDLSLYTEQREMAFYRLVVDAAQVSNNPALANFFGDRILAKDPTDFPTLLAVARVTAGKPPKDPKEKEEALARAQELGQFAVNYVVAYLNSPNSAKIPPEQRIEWSYRAHSLMGLIFSQKEEWANAEKAYIVALSFKKDDPVAYFYLGVALFSQKRFEEAVDVAQKSAFQKGPLQSNAKDLLRILYRETKRSMGDIDKDIQGAGERLGKQ
jgi:hypothetical protein